MYSEHTIKITNFFNTEADKLYKEYVNLHINIQEELFDLAVGIISSFSIVGIEEKHDELIVCFDSLEFSDEIKDNLLINLKVITGSADITKVERIQDKNWNEEYEKKTRSIIVNDRIGIAPEWKKDELNTPIKIIINPKMSFGTGEHATTRLVALLMEDKVSKDSFWIDAGCGSGVLAILAIKLGAREAFAFDYDIWSVENTKENLVLNEVVDKITIEQADIHKVELPESDGITANLFAHLLIDSFPKFYKSLVRRKGDLIISGVLIYDGDMVKESALKAGFNHIETIAEDEWVSMHFKA